MRLSRFEEPVKLVFSLSIDEETEERVAQTKKRFFRWCKQHKNVQKNAFSACFVQFSNEILIAILAAN